jgi:hypothetical protein
MATNVVYNGTTYTVPGTGDQSWSGTNGVDGLLIALAQNAFQKTGGLFSLSADSDFGPSAGLVSTYFKSRSSNVAASGALRLAVGDTIGFRNNANLADLSVGVNGSDQLTFGGTKLLLSGAVVNADINAAAAIAYSKLSLAGSIQNSDLAGSIAYSKLVLTGAIVSGDLAGNIARSKLASGSANQVVINDGTGNLSSEANLAITRGGTGQATASAAFDALAPTTTKGDIIVRNSSTNTNQPIGTDGQVLVADSSQAVGLKWTTLNQGAKNYITYNNFENNATTGWTLGHASLTSNLPSGAPTFGSGYDSHLGISIFQPSLAGTYSLSYNSSGSGGAALVAGDFLSTQVYSIDKEDQSKVLTFKFYFQASTTGINFSGTSSNTFGVAIYDVTNSAWIIPAGVWGMTQGTGVGYCTGTFQTPYNMTQFRLVLFNANTTAGAVAILLDDFSVGPQTAPYGPVVTDWQSYTPTISPISGYATSWSPQGFWRRVGQNMEGYIKWRKDTNAGTGAGNLTFSIPSGYTIDTTITEATDTVIGFAKTYNFQLATSYDRLYGLSVGAGGTVIQFRKVGAATIVVGTDVGANAEFYAHFTVPIVGWSSNVQMSSDTDTRVVAASANLSSGSHGTSGSYIILSGGTWTIEKDSHAAMSTGGTYTVPVSGWFELSGSLGFASNATGIRALAFYRNGSALTTPTQVTAVTGADTLVGGSALVYCNAGDTLQIGGYQNSGGSLNYNNTNNETRFSVKRLSGPAVVAATETVACRYTNTAGTTLTKSSNNTVPFPTKDYDTHGAFVTDTFTAPVSGKYAVKATLTLSSGATWANTDSLILEVLKNGTIHTGSQFVFSGTVSAAPNQQVTATVNCVAGDTIKINCNPNKGSAGNINLATSAGYNALAIDRIGN